MCGRFTSITPPDRLAEIFDCPPPTPGLFDEEFRPNHNVPPTARVAAVALDAGGHRRLGRFTWGLVPSWSKDPRAGARLINARSETVLEKPSFRNLVPRHRCIVPLDGFYEWRTVAVDGVVPTGPKQPVYAVRRDGSPIAAAGLWTTWRGNDGVTMHTCCLLTTEANGTMAPIHDRMPVILERDDWDDWLDAEIEVAVALMRPAADSVLLVRDVSPRVNSVRNNGPELIEPLTG